MMRKLILGGIMLIMAVARPAAADDVIGRYQMVLIQGDAHSSRVLVLDTRDGHLWEWWEGGPLTGAPHAGTTYVGRIAVPDLPSGKGEAPGRLRASTVP